MISLRKTQLGQSMVEYTIVAAFGIMTLSSQPMQDVMAKLAATLKENYEGYSYAISLTDIPDASNSAAYRTLLDDLTIPTEHKDKLADDVLAYHKEMKRHNIPNPPALPSPPKLPF